MKNDITEIVKRALEEDIGSGDVTTQFFLPQSREFKGAVIAKENGIICGVEPAEKAFLLACPGVKVRILIKDGKAVSPGSRIMEVSGGREILTAERTALNFLQRLSGIATMTARFAEKIKGSKTKILDTRKTTPGMRFLEKYAVTCGGGRNHRMGLYDAVLIKDNHIAGWKETTDKKEEKQHEFIKNKMRLIKKRFPKMIIEMEAQNIKQVFNALACGVDIILLDNMSEPDIARAVKIIKTFEKSSLPKDAGLKTRPQTEISGGVNLNNIARLAKLGCDRISVGMLTHSPKALDISFELED